MSFYTKPHNVKYTDMCIWIDQNVYTEGVDESKVFEYLYHISRMLAYKKGFFEKGSYYDDFALFMANKLFLRLKNPKQFGENPSLSKIKSILNYAKCTLNANRILFQSDEFAQNYQCTDETDLDTVFNSTLFNSSDDLSIVNFKCYLDDINKTIRGFVNKLPHKNKAELDNIYISCMLSFLSSITLSKKSLSRLDSLVDADKLTQHKLNSLYKYERANCMIYYHIDRSMYPLINVYVNELRHLIASNLTLILNESINTEQCEKSIMISSIYSDLNKNKGESNK